MFKNVHKRKKKGQSTLEYILLVTAIVILFLAFLRKSGPFARIYNATLGTTASTMSKMANRISNSQLNLPRNEL